jgi:hypothetical protein
MDEALTFEALRAALGALEVPAGEARRLRWVIDGPLGAAKTASGDFEIFLLGGPLVARSPVVRRCLEHGAWQPTTGGEAFDASRIVLPADPHFAAMAALIATELVRAGIGDGVPPQEAFTEVEPLIELAIQRGSLTDEVMLGLFGELLVLRTMLRGGERSLAEKAVLIGAWRGWGQGRDLVLGRQAIEVKATRGLASSHAFSGLHQLEEQALPDGDLETLHLMSLGLQEVTEGGQTLPELVDDLVAELGGPIDPEVGPGPQQAQLLGWIAQYGAGGRGYRHLSMRGWPQYQARLALSFSPRLYRIRDSAVRLLDRAEIDQTFVRADSVTFEATFPPKVSAFNPADSWQAELIAMADALLASHAP